MATAIKIDAFGGIQPRLDDTALGDSQATVAKNCRLQTTKLNPIREALAVTDMPIRLENGLRDVKGAQTICIWTRGDGVRDVIAWPGIVRIAPSNINDDDRFRLFVTGETGVRDENGEDQPCVFVSSKNAKTYDRHPLYKDLPPPVSVSYWTEANPEGVSSVELDAATIRHTYFFQTFVDEYGYESGQSEVATDSDGNMIEFDYNNNQKINWKGIARMSADYTIPDWVVARRLYMSVAGDTSDTVRFICEQKITEGTQGAFEMKLKININDEDVSEEAPSITSTPVDLTWMTQMPGNFYVGFRRSNPRCVCFSDVSLPTSFPDAYQYTIRDFAIGIAVAGNTAFVLTKGYPWALSGTAPEGITAAQIVSEQACVSARSICSFEGKVYYASQDGICVLAENSLNATVVTRAYWDKVSWEKLNPSSCMMAAYDNALFCYFTLEDGTHRAYVIDFDIGGNPIITEHDDYASCVFTDVENDKLYFVGV